MVYKLSFKTHIKAPGACESRNNTFAKVFERALQIQTEPSLSFHSNEGDLSFLGTVDQAFLFELNGFTMDDIAKSPYKMYRAAIVENEPISRLLHDVPFEKVYATCDAIERQQLALDPITILSCSRKPPKARALLVDWIPWYSSTKKYCIILTSLGDCRLYRRNSMQTYFLAYRSNLNSLLFDILPKYDINPTDISTFNELIAYVNRYYITAFCCDPLDCFIYLATAAGIIVCFEFNLDSGHAKPIFYCQSQLGHITYMRCYGYYMIIGNILGILQLFKVNHKSYDKKIQLLHSLWDEEDRIPCRKVLINDIDYPNTFIIVFYKCTTIIALLLTNSDINSQCLPNICRVIAVGKHIMGGIKITGLEAISATEYMVTMMTGFFIKVKIDISGKNTLHFKHRIVYKFASNMNILTCASSKNHIFWSLLMSSKVKLNNGTKAFKEKIFLKVYKLKVENPLKVFLDSSMANRLDILLGIKLDIINSEKKKKNFNYIHFLNKSVEELDDPLPLLQAGYFIASQRHQFLCTRSIREEKPFEMNFLQAALQILIIKDRLIYLRSIKKLTSFTTFQRIAIKCMLYTYAIKFRQIKISNKYAPPVMKGLIDKFLQFATKEWRHCTFKSETLDLNPDFLTSDCDICQKKFNNIQSEQCASGHFVERCGISCTPLPITAKHSQCVICKVRLLPIVSKSKLKELYACGDIIKYCPYCQGGLKTIDV